MGIEIERKFLLTSDEWKQGNTGVLYRQGYLCSTKEQTVRIRVAGDKAFLTIKSATVGIRRMEFEYPLPVKDAEIMLDTICKQPIIEKYRYTISYQGFIWEVDEFLGANRGLVVAEVELETENQYIIKPPWVGREVSGDYRYFNSALCRHPYSRW